MIDHETILCISIAERPGKYGVFFHNLVYEALGLNQIYIPMQVNADELEYAIHGVRALKIKGCSVSMPHKEQVIQYLDSIDPIAEQIGAVNTIVRQADGTLKGYNTDYSGAKRALQTNIGLQEKRVVMLGAGGVARAIAQAVIDLGGKLTIANRSFDRGKDLADKVKATVIQWEDLQNKKLYGDLLINATSIGMGEYISPVSKEILGRFIGAYDVVLGKTRFIDEARELNLKAIPAEVMCTYQAAEQVKLYTGHDVPEDIIQPQW